MRKTLKNPKKIKQLVENGWESFTVLFKDAAEKGILLILAAVFAIWMANSKYGDLYNIVINDYIKIIFGDVVFKFTLHYFINDFLMVIFFLLVGLEIKKELVAGHLSTNEQRIMPLVAAISGVVFPALIYYSLNYHDPIKLRGWAIPAATDIAFALGIFALFARGLPGSLRIFLTALAIIDDLIAVLIIAFFYSGGVEWAYLVYILGMCFILYFFNVMNHDKLISYAVLGIFLWYLFLRSGIHTTVAGVLLGFFIPYKCKGSKLSPAEDMEKKIHPFVSYFLLPVFAFANSGVVLQSISLETFTNTISLGIILGLVVGKSLGISGTVALMKKFNIAKAPEGSNMMQFFAVSTLCGIGFTMSLFIGGLAYEENPEMMTNVKVGVLFGSLISATFGAILIRFFCKNKANA